MAEAEASVIEQTDSPADGKMEIETKKEEDDCNFPIAECDETAKFIDELEEGAQKLSIDVANHPVNLLKNMEKLKNDKDTCDVILRVKKGNYYWASFWAHKSVLAAYSPVFAEALKKFQTYGLPAVETVCRPNLVLPRKIHGAALAALVDWMYTGKLTVHRKALGHLPLVANFLKVQAIIDRLPEIFEDFKDSGVKLIDQEIDGEIEIGKENDDNEGNDEETESKTTANGEAKKEETPAAEPAATGATATDGEATTTEVKQKKEWIVNLWLKRQVAGKLPKIKPIPGFYIMLQSDAHRVKSSRGRKGQDPFDPPESIMDTNWLAAYNQFKAKQMHLKKDQRNNQQNNHQGSNRGGNRGGGGQTRGNHHGRGQPRGYNSKRGNQRGGGGPVRSFQGGRGGGGYNRGGGGNYRGGRGGGNQNSGWNAPPPPPQNYGPPQGGWYDSYNNSYGGNNGYNNGPPPAQYGGYSNNRGGGNYGGGNNYSNQNRNQNRGGNRGGGGGNRGRGRGNNRGGNRQRPY